MTIRAFRLHDGRLSPTEDGLGADVADLPLPVWVDMHNPSAEEEREVEALLGIELPTREEMQEIEISSRLYQEDGALFMTVSLLNRSGTDEPESVAITFILAERTLVTVRYADPMPFRTYLSKRDRTAAGPAVAESVLIGLIEQVVDRLADILEGIMLDLEGVSRTLFAKPEEETEAEYSDLLRRIGHAGNLTSKATDSLLGLNRLARYLSAQPRIAKDVKAQLKTVLRDIVSINEHANFLNTKVTFLLDATLGLINIEQNGIIKIFSVAAVAFLPPTLIASIYGMNFQFMPELHWPFGYPLALGLMVLSAVLPMWYFKHKGWL